MPERCSAAVHGAGLRARLRLDRRGTRARAVARHAAAGDEAAGLRHELEHGRVVRGDPARRDLRVGETASPVDLRAAVDQHRPRVDEEHAPVGAAWRARSAPRAGSRRSRRRCGSSSRLDSHVPRLARREHARVCSSGWLQDGISAETVCATARFAVFVTRRIADRPVLGGVGGRHRGEDLAAARQVELVGRASSGESGVAASAARASLAFFSRDTSSRSESIVDARRRTWTQVRTSRRASASVPAPRTSAPARSGRGAFMKHRTTKRGFAQADPAQESAAADRFGAILLVPPCRCLKEISPCVSPQDRPAWPAPASRALLAAGLAACGGHGSSPPPVPRRSGPTQPAVPAERHVRRRLQAHEPGRRRGAGAVRAVEAALRQE